MPSPLRFFTENWRLKLLAIALALLLWVVVSAEQVTSQWIPVPLVVEENDPQFELLSGPEIDEVQVRFTGSGRDLMELAIRKPPLVLSIERVQATTQEFRLQPSMVRLPTQLAVNAQEVRAPVIRLTFHRLAERLLTVRPVVESEIDSDWILVDSLRLLPEQITVRGPADQVERLPELRTVPFTLPASDSIFSTLIPIDTTGLNGLDVSDRQVRVTGRVDRVVERQLADVPISVGYGVTMMPTTVDVLLSGPRSIVEAMQSEDFRVVVAIPSIPEEIGPEGVSVPLRLEQLPPRVTGSIVPPAGRLFPVSPAEPPAQEDDGATGEDDAGSVPLGEPIQEPEGE